MIFNKYLKLNWYSIYLLAMTLVVSCADFDQDFEDERYLTGGHFDKITESGSTLGVESIDGAILSYFRDGESGTDAFGLKAVQLGMDLRSNDMDMSVRTWFGRYSLYDNTILTDTNLQSSCLSFEITFDGIAMVFLCA